MQSNSSDSHEASSGCSTGCMCPCRSPGPGHSSAGSLLRQDSHAGGGWACADAGDSIWQGAAVPAIPPRAGESGLINMAMHVCCSAPGQSRLHAANLCLSSTHWFSTPCPTPPSDDMPVALIPCKVNWDRLPEAIPTVESTLAYACMRSSTLLLPRLSSLMLCMGTHLLVICQGRVVKEVMMLLSRLELFGVCHLCAGYRTRLQLHLLCCATGPLMHSAAARDCDGAILCKAICTGLTPKLEPGYCFAEAEARPFPAQLLLLVN